jgi:tetratricopeptide (TPR) repeat protein
MAKKGDNKELKKIEKAQEASMSSLAMELSNKYVVAYPDDIEGLWLKATSLYNLERNLEAKQHFEAIIPRLSDDFLGAAHTYLARICNETGNLNEAERYYTEAIEIDQKDSDNYVELGDILLVLNRSADAEKLVAKGIKAVASPIADLYFFLGRLLKIKGEIVKAVEAFRRVLADRADENAEAAIEDLKQTAALKGIDFPEEPSEDETESEKVEKEPGSMTATIHREFFADIAAGRKTVEYRDATEYWEKRIEKAGATPFHLRLINGMAQTAPELSVIVEKVLLDIWDSVYELHLGEVIDLKHWDKEKEAPM